MIKSSVKIFSLGGWGKVTQNMFVYETAKDILVVDCGVGFPEEEMMGVDLVIPDVSYLIKNRSKVRAIILTHGHDDHIGGLPYIIPQLGGNVDVYGPRWAMALSRQKFEEFGLTAGIKFQEVNEETHLTIGDFSVSFVQVPHSIPDTYHLVIGTPAGRIYHAADFKLDLWPVMGKPASQKKITQIGKEGVLCLLSDCLGSERPGFTPPETKLEELFEKEMSSCRGQFFMTTMSSNISRLKQAIDVALKLGRKVVLVGRSVEKNAELAQSLGYFKYPPQTLLNLKGIRNFRPRQLAFIVAGSQAQLGSALDRIVGGEVKEVKIGPGDKIIFSTDYIPGNETAMHLLIDNIFRLGAEVIYPDISNQFHVSGHGSQEDLGKLMELVSPKYLIPIGGNFRHMVSYKNLAIKRGFLENQLVLPDGGQIVEFLPSGRVNLSNSIETRQVMVDALGVGDVGNVVLRDRKILSEEGIVVSVLPVDQNSHQLLGEPEMITRGFIYIKENTDLLNKAKDKIKNVFQTYKGKNFDYRVWRKKIQDELEHLFFETTGRRPMVLVVLIEV